MQIERDLGYTSYSLIERPIIDRMMTNTLQTLIRY
jgi:hypothetical protein